MNQRDNSALNPTAKSNVLLLLFTLLLSTLLGGCSTSGGKPDAVAAGVAAHNKTAAEGDKIICKYVSETGTFIKKRRCRTVDEIKRERETAQRRMDQIMSGGTNTSGSSN